MKVNEFKEYSAADLAERIATEKANLNKLIVSHSISPIENPMTIKYLRRDIARMVTVLHEKNAK